MEINTVSKKILRELCTNSRVSITELSNKLGISRYRIVKEIENLETNLAIYYTLELDYKKLGFDIMHVMYLKFSKRPTANKISEVIGGSIDIQFAAMTKGAFDLILFVAAKNPIENSQIEVAMQEAFAEYGASIHSAEVTLMRLGFIPFGNEFIINSNLKEVYKKILMALNQNSKVRLREISEKVGISEDLIKYYMDKMEKAQIIKRYTAVIRKSSEKKSIVYLANYTVRKGIQDRIERERRELYFNEEFLPVINEFQIMFSISGSAQALTLGTFKNLEYGLGRSVRLHNKIYAIDKPQVDYASITRIVKGMLPIRNVDIKSNYDKTSWPSKVV